MVSPTSLSRRQLSRRGLLAAGGALAATSLAGCGSGRPSVTFYQSKREIFDHVQMLLGELRAEQPNYNFVHDVASNLSAGFARRNPPDVALQNYNLEMSRFRERGGLSDLSDMEEASRIRDDINELADWYPPFPGETSVLPWSVASAAVIYNRGIFDEHGLSIPTTWTEFTELCAALQDAGVTPIYGTFADPWTLNQGMFDYTVGGMTDVRATFETMTEIGEDVGPDSEDSFSKAWAEPIARMLELLPFHQEDAPARTYNEGNTAMAQGKAAMLLQGPWALPEIAKAETGVEMGMFPLPVTEDPADLKIRVNIDLALWIPRSADQQEGARELVKFFMRPEVQDTYNQDFLYLGTTKDAPPATDPRIVEMQKYYDESRFYMGASQFIPFTIPWANYLQAIVFGEKPETMLARLDREWASIAFRS
ncbi:ABC transporter substrate-binding protein [Brachybacterium hainanense]|uniref:ABC transporter substrate-binding protein n=1 Tax=Brachybacterium hainanense TaxID=1541174 RepID=A0ABV6R8G7_9MICO